MNNLIKIQEELKAPKGNFNSFGKYKYRSCEDILEAVKPLLSKYNCQLTLSDELQQVGERYYIKATARLISEDCGAAVTAYAREEETKKGMDGSQITGTASSYARKYALNGLFLIDDTKDADTDEYTKQTKGPVKKEKKSAEELSEMKPADKITEGGCDYITNLCIETNSDMAGLLKFYKIKSLRDMTVEQFNHCVAALERKKK